MKKLVSLLLSIMLTISMTTNMAFAGNRVDSTVEEAVMYNSDGEELKFKLKKLSDDQYKMEFYIEDELIRVYDMDMSSTAPITVKDVRTAQVEIIERAKPTRMSAPAVTYGPTRWTSLGYVHYAKSRALGAETCAAVSARSADYYEDRYAIDTDVSKKVDNLVTFVAGTLIGTKLPPPTGGWLGVCLLYTSDAADE